MHEERGGHPPSLGSFAIPRDFHNGTDFDRLLEGKSSGQELAFETPWNDQISQCRRNRHAGAFLRKYMHKGFLVRIILNLNLAMKNYPEDNTQKHHDIYIELGFYMLNSIQPMIR